MRRIFFRCICGAEQKKRAYADARLEAERSIALKTQRDQMAKDSATKAAATAQNTAPL